MHSHASDPRLSRRAILSALLTLLLGATVLCSAAAAQTNVSLGKASWQSSTRNNLSAILAEDGNTTTYSQTNFEDNPWWEVNLGANYVVSSITIFNLTDSPWRLNNFDLSLANASGQVIWTTNYPGWFAGSYTFSIPNITAQRVKIQLRSMELLGLAEVQVFGTVPTPAVAFTTAQQTVGEAAGTVNASVKVTTPNGLATTAPVTVNYQAISGTATSPGDYVLAAGSTTFPTGTASGGTQQIPVSITADTLGEPTEAFTVRLVSATGANLASPTDQTITIQDDDSRVITATKAVSAGATNGKYDEGENVTYTITLSNTGGAAQADNPGDEMVDVVPPALTVLSATASAGTAASSGQTVTWNGSIAAGASVTVTAVARILDGFGGTTVANQAVAHYDPTGAGTNSSDAPSNTVSFSVEQRPLLPVALVQPTANANMPAATVAFEWQSLAGATSYLLRICFASGCSGSGLVASDTVTATTAAHSLATGSYTYSVLAYQGASLIGQSELRAFSVQEFCTGGFAVGDFNGDGRVDRLCSADGQVRVSVATDRGFAAPTVWLSQSLTKVVVGDFNGDGLTDLANFDNSVGGTFYVALSTGTLFGPPTEWGSASTPEFACRYVYAVPGAADFNSDGKTDVYCQILNVPGDSGGSDGRVVIGISTGSSFAFYLAGNAWCNEYQTTGTFDYDGDGRPDYYCISRNHNYPSVTVYPMVNGTLGAGIVAVTANFCELDQYAFGDVNGDGKTDIVCPSSGQVALSTGNAYLHQGFFTQSCQGPAFTVQPFTADVDGDGRAEVLCNNKKGDATNITVRRWTGTALGPEQTWMSSFCSGTDANSGVVTVGDFNGDGQSDLLCNKMKPAVAGYAGVRPDLMVAATNGVGGTTSVAYRPSTDYPTANAGASGVRQVVSAVSGNDGRGNVSTSYYAYAGGFVNRPERQFMGFSYVRQTMPCLATDGGQCPFVETALSQELTSVGSPIGIYRYDGTGQLLAAVTNTYTNTTATPPRTTLDRTDSYVFGETTSDVLHTYSSYTYDNYGNVLTSLAAGSDTTTNDDLEAATQYSYNTSAYIVGLPGQVVRRAPGGSALTTEKYVYDGATDWTTPPTKGDLTKLKRLLTPPGREVSRTMTYDSYGNPRSVTDETSRTVQTTYDTTDTLFPATVTNGASETTTYAWDAACGAVTSVTDPNSKTTTTTYDALCRPTLTSAPLSAYEQKTYTWSAGNLLTLRTDAPAGNGASGTAWSEAYLDGFGRTWKTVSRGPSSGQEIVAEKGFNARGGVDWSDEPRYTGDTERTTHYEYDALGRVTRVTMPGNREVTTSYAATSVTTTDPDGKTTTTRTDGFGRTTSVERPFGASTATTSTTYDRLGRRVGMTDPIGASWSWTYDSLGRMTAQNDPDAGNWTYVYDDAGRLTSQTDAKSQTTTLTYDTQVGRLATRQNAVGTVTYTYSQPRGSYSNKGRLTTVTSPADTLKTDYDALGRVVKQDRLIGTTHYVVTKTYDAASLVSIAYPDGDTVGPMQYDGAGRVSSVSGILTSVSYDALGRPLTQSNGNGTTTSWTYGDTRGFLTRIQTTGGGGTIQDLQYTQYTDAGLLQQVTSPIAGEGWSYAYDDLNHLTTATNLTNSADTQTYSYDAGDRILSSSRYGIYVYPGTGGARPHGPTSVGGTAIIYDLNGNTLTAGTRGLTWNADNRLSQTTLGGVTATYSYGGDGDRVKKTSSLGTSLYPFGDDYEITGGVTTKYIPVAGLGVVAKRVGTGGSAVTYWLHTDRLGSIQAVTNAAGAAVFRRQYRPYGETLAQTGSHTESRGWIDQRNDGENGLTYLHARYFDPQLGVFTSADPLGVAGGMNQYAYALGNPANGSDRSGTEVCFVNAPTGSAGGTTDANYHSPQAPQVECVGGGPYQGGRELSAAEANYGLMVNTRFTTIYVGDQVYAQVAEQLYVAKRPVEATVTTSEEFNGVKPGPELTCAKSENPAACALALGVTALKPDETIYALMTEAIKAGALQGGLNVAIGAIGAAGSIQFGQRGVSAAFRNGEFAGKTIDEVAAGLRSGVISPSQLPLQTITRDGITYTLNNRSLMALRLGGVEPTVISNVTGNPFFEAQLTGRLLEMGGSVPPGFVPIIRGIP